MNRRMLIAAAAALALGAGPAFAQSGAKPMKLTLNFLAAAPNAGFQPTPLTEGKADDDEEMADDE